MPSITLRDLSKPASKAGPSWHKLRSASGEREADEDVVVALRSAVFDMLCELAYEVDSKATNGTVFYGRVQVGGRRLEGIECRGCVDHLELEGIVQACHVHLEPAVRAPSVAVVDHVGGKLLEG
jgi:hypothetical protein